MTDDTPRWDARTWPLRPLGGFETLLTAAEGYPALERAALAAERAIWLWFRVFDPEMPLKSPEALSEGAETWRDLLALRLEAGVAVAVAVADFDPVGARRLHQAAVASVRAMASLRGFERFDVMLADHPARSGAAWRTVAFPLAQWRVEQARRDLLARRLGLAAAPGLARHLAEREGRLVWRAPSLPLLKPATHHQKLAVFDGARAILGGLDVDERRWDDPDHDRPAESTWRDVSVAVDGPVARDAALWFAGLWNAQRPRMGRDAPRALPVPDPAPADDGPPADGGLRLSTTLSGDHPDESSVGPLQRVDGLERDHLALIARAERLIYIETQFLRSRRIVRALAARARRAPGLGLVLVLPGAPENVAFEGASGPMTRFGEWLQARGVRRLMRAFGPRAAVVSPARPRPRRTGDRSSLHGAGLVYVHSKVLVVDDAAAIVSSANLNGRSLRWDTESGVVVEHAATARELRLKLWRALLGDDPPEAALHGPDAPAEWRRIALENAARPPAERRGLILPYDLRAAARFGMRAPYIPEEMV